MKEKLKNRIIEYIEKNNSSWETDFTLNIDFKTENVDDEHIDELIEIFLKEHKQNYIGDGFYNGKDVWEILKDLLKLKLKMLNKIKWIKIY